MKLSDQTISEIKLHYQEEYQTTLRRLKEIESVLKELEPFSITISKISDYNTIVGQEATLNTAASKKPTEKPKAQYKKRSKKRGRKSVWGDFILKRLRAVNRPLTYDELANHAQVSLNIDPLEFDKTRKALVSAVFQLRNKQDKVATFRKTNSRDKYVLLVKWLNENKEPLDVMRAYME